MKGVDCLVENALGDDDERVCVSVGSVGYIHIVQLHKCEVVEK